MNPLLSQLRGVPPRGQFAVPPEQVGQQDWWNQPPAPVAPSGPLPEGWNDTTRKAAAVQVHSDQFPLLNLVGNAPSLPPVSQSSQTSWDAPPSLPVILPESANAPSAPFASPPSDVPQFASLEKATQRAPSLSAAAWNPGVTKATTPEQFTILDALKGRSDKLAGGLQAAGNQPPEPAGGRKAWNTFAADPAVDPKIIAAQAANEIAAMGLPEPSDRAMLTRFTPGASAAGANVAAPPRAPHQPQLSAATPQGFDGRSGLQRLLDGDAEQAAAGRQQQMQEFDAGNMRYANANGLTPRNASEAWQMGRMLDSGRSMSPSDVQGTLDQRIAGYNQSHPGAPFNGGLQIASASPPTDSDALAKQKRAQGLTSIDAGRARFGGAYDAVVGHAADDARARKARLGEGNQSQLMRMMGVDPTNGNPLNGNGGDNPMAEVMRLGMMAGPDVAREWIRARAATDGTGLDVIESHRNSLLGATQEIMNRNPGMSFKDAYRQAEQTLGPVPQFGPQPGRLNPQAGPPGQFNVPTSPGQAGPASPAGVNPQTNKAVIEGGGDLMSSIGLPTEATFQDAANWLSRVVGTSAEPDEETLRRVVAHMKSLGGKYPGHNDGDNLFTPEVTEAFKAIIDAPEGASLLDIYKQARAARRERDINTPSFF